MTNVTVLDDLYRYNDWANYRLFQLCDGLADSQLDESRPMGFGSLRATLFHNLEAEELWFGRWTGATWRALATDPAGISLKQLAHRFAEAARTRQQLISDERSSAWKRIVDYRDSTGTPYQRPLEDLLLHVANHAIHHRAQALNFLRAFGRTVPAGLDYIFYRFARPSVTQADESISAMREYGLEMATESGVEVDWDSGIVRKYFQYHDWANRQLIELAAACGDESLDRSFEMGQGSIRKTLLHLFDAERWWIKNWTIGTSPFDHSPAETPISQLDEDWTDTASRRNDFVGGLDSESAKRIVSVSGGGPLTRVQVIESLVQLCCHGTHHRAQVVNMFRQCEVTAPALDLVVWANR